MRYVRACALPSWCVLHRAVLRHTQRAEGVLMFFYVAMIPAALACRALTKREVAKHYPPRDWR